MEPARPRLVRRIVYGPCVAFAGAWVALLAACSSAPQPNLAGRPPALPSPADIAWLGRLSFGVDSASLDELARDGRRAYLARQLRGTRPALPDAIVRQVDAFEVSHLDVVHEFEVLRRERERIKQLSDPVAGEQARKALNERGRLLAREASERLVLESMYSRNQLQEQMVWFWLNHFSVHDAKANLRWLVGDYERNAIRPHALGRFRDLVLATLQHPAMLEYLDNAQNAQGHVNENYARELMELHTLGVQGGYTQKDVQELARVLTGVGIWNGGERPHMRREWQSLYRREGLMEFLPRRHDFGPKVLLGRAISGHGYAEVEEAVDRLVRTPACATFIARKLAVYFVADDPPPALVERLAATFARTDGDIGAVLQDLFRSPELEASLGHQFQDPYHYLIGALRFAYDGQALPSARPVVQWLGALGEAPFGRQTPDGYPATESGWTGSGQLERRFEIARALGSGAAGPLAATSGAVPTVKSVSRLATPLYSTAIEPRLSGNTRSVLADAKSPAEWNALLLASPELNQR